MVRTCACLLVVAFSAPPAVADLTEETREELTLGFEGLGASPGAADARALARRFADESLSDADWRAFFTAYFESHPFTPALGTFFRGTLGATSGPAQARVAQRSGIAAATAFGEHAQAVLDAAGEAAHRSAATALEWLSDLVEGLSPGAAGVVLEALQGALEGGAAGLVPAAGSVPAPDPPTAWLGAQFALVARDYAARAGRAGAVPAVLGLREGGLRFWQAYGVLLLDNGGLDAVQIESLGSLYGAIPRELHAIGALIVPETTGIDAAASGLRSQSGQLVFIPAIPMVRRTWFGEFAPSTPQPEAALFTVTAGQQITRAIQAVQFAARPDLVVRRNAVIHAAGLRNDAYLRRGVAPQVYLQDPGELLPSIAYLWFVNSVAAFNTAAYISDLGEPVASDQFLLLADLFSGGGGRTVFFATDPAGRVARDTTALLRSYLLPLPAHMVQFDPGARAYVPGTVYVTGIVVGGAPWTFDIGPRGIVTTRYLTTRLE